MHLFLALTPLLSPPSLLSLCLSSSSSSSSLQNVPDVLASVCLFSFFNNALNTYTIMSCHYHHSNNNAAKQHEGQISACIAASSSYVTGRWFIPGAGIAPAHVSHRIACPQIPSPRAQPGYSMWARCVCVYVSISLALSLLLLLMLRWWWWFVKNAGLRADAELCGWVSESKAWRRIGALTAAPPWCKGTGFVFEYHIWHDVE